MNEKEIAEIKRRFRKDKGNINKIHCFYVNEKKEVVSRFTKSLSSMVEEEREELLKIMKKTFSGAVNKNLINIEFSTEQVGVSEEHRLLTELRDSELENQDALNSLCEKIISSIKLDTGYLIMIAGDKYDVPTFTKDDEMLDDGSDDVFSYYVCSICPVKATKSALGYFAYENDFRSIGEECFVSAPEIGFMFPSFDDRSTNIYGALYYTRNTKESYKEFTDAVFNTEIPLPASVQKETFDNILAQSVDDECSYDFLQSVHTKISEIIDEHKVCKDEEPLTLSRNTVKNVLLTCGASEDHINVFEKKYNEAFGEKTEINPANIVDTKHFEVRTPNVKIQVNPEYSYMLDTRIIDGVKYIMIRAEEGVEVNGVSIHFLEQENSEGPAEE